MDIYITQWCREMHCDEDMYATDKTLLGAGSTEECAQEFIKEHIKYIYERDKDDPDLPDTCPSQEIFEEIYDGYFEVVIAKLDEYVVK